MRRTKLKILSAYLLILSLVFSALAYNKMTMNRLNSVPPSLKAGFIKTEKEMKIFFPGINLEVISACRSCEEQNRLYEQGRTRPGKIVTNAKCGQSFHNYCLAIDVAAYKNGKLYKVGNNFNNKLAEIVTKNGLESGCNWKNFKDCPHIQIPRSSYNLSDARKDFKRGGVGEVFVNAEEEMAKAKARRGLSFGNQTAASKPKTKKCSCDCICG